MKLLKRQSKEGSIGKYFETINQLIAQLLKEMNPVIDGRYINILVRIQSILQFSNCMVHLMVTHKAQPSRYKTP